MHSGWSHISGRVFITGIILKLALSISAFAQQPGTRPYESEEDLWEALSEGEISYADYLDLLEISRIGTGDTLVPASDWEELPGSGAGYLIGPDTTERIAQSAKEREQQTRSARWYLRSGYNGDLAASGGGDAYTAVRFRNSNLAGLLDWRHDGTRGSWQRRLIMWQTHGLTAQAGNIEPRIGRGLIVGRRSRLIGTSNANRSDGNWWQPVRSRFNGLWISTGETRAISGDIVASDIRSKRLTERMAALQLSAGSKLVRFGLTGLAGEIKRRDSAGLYAERVWGGHLRIGKNERQLLAEVAVARGGATAKAAEAIWQFEGGRFHGSAWSYPTDFFNPWGGGPGHADTRKVTPAALGESFASRTAGERGFSLATRIEPRAQILGGQAGINWEWMTHRETPSQPLQHAWAARAQWQRGQLTVRPFARGAVDSIQKSRYGFGSSADFGTPERQLSVRVEYGRHNSANTRYVRAGFGAKWKFSEAIQLRPTVRWVDPDLSHPGDGYWYLYFTEVITAASGMRIEAALVWQKYEERTRGDNAELRLRLIAGI